MKGEGVARNARLIADIARNRNVIAREAGVYTRIFYGTVTRRSTEMQGDHSLGEDWRGLGNPGPNPRTKRESLLSEDLHCAGFNLLGNLLRC